MESAEVNLIEDVLDVLPDASFLTGDEVMDKRSFGSMTTKFW